MEGAVKNGKGSINFAFVFHSFIKTKTKLINFFIV